MKHLPVYILCGLSILASGCEKLTSSEPTEDQSYYFRSQIGNTEKIEIKEHPKLGGETLAVITDPNEILKICMDIELDRVHAPTGSFGRLDLIFHTAGGDTFKINYSPEKNRMKFENRWNIEGVPYESIPGRITKHLKSQPVGTGQPM